MSTDPRVLRSERFQEIGRLLKQDASLLVDRWCTRAVVERPEASRMHHDLLRDDLVMLIGHIGDSLEDCGPPHHRAIALQHGGQRWQVGWSLTDLVFDYQLIRLVILDYLDETLDRQLEHNELLALGMFLDEAIAASVAAYVEYSEQSMRSLQEDLQKQAQDLRDAERRKDEFLATLAHELRNPLSPILHSVEAINLTGTSDPTVRHVCGVIERQVQQITRLVDDLLDITRISQGKIELRKEWVDLGHIVAQAVQTCGPLIKARQHQLSIDMPAEPIQLEADPARLVQIVANLLNNAAKYTDPGGRIWLSCEQTDGQVQISVRDNGTGIAQEMLACVFDMYRQVDVTATRSQGGLGIGLTLVKQLVELHDGRVRATSDGLGLGSRFTVRLPVGNPTLSQSEAPRTYAATTGRRILIVEDSSDTRDMLRELLQLCGHEVQVAENGQQALSCVNGWKPEFALVDIGLPKMNGFDLASELRSLMKSNVCLVALTGYGQASDRKRAIEVGFDAFLIKPVRLEELTRLLSSQK